MLSLCEVDSILHGLCWIIDFVVFYRTWTTSTHLILYSKIVFYLQDLFLAYLCFGWTCCWLTNEFGSPQLKRDVHSIDKKHMLSFKINCKQVTLKSQKCIQCSSRMNECRGQFEHGVSLHWYKWYYILALRTAPHTHRKPTQQHSLPTKPPPINTHYSPNTHKHVTIPTQPSLMSRTS